MKSDYIVTEPDTPASARLAPKLAIGAGLFALAFYLAGDRNDEPAPEALASATSAQDDIALVPRTHEARSLLDDIAPISSAQAAIAPPSAALEDTERSNAALLDLAAQPPAAPLEPQDEAQLVRLESRELVVRNGDSLSILFDRNGLKPIDWMALAKLDGDAKRLLRLRPGDKLMLGLDDEQRVAALDMRIDDTKTLRIRRDEDGQYEQSLLVDDLSVREVAVEGVIENSLFLSAKSAGLSDRLTMELTDIFAWDVDFALDIRAGDRFRVIYEELYRDGKLLPGFDDGSIAGRRGSLTVDDEGTPTSETVLIEDGILKGYMQDRMNARLMGVKSTGNGRRQSYAHCPMVRMTNTYMLAGDKDPGEILASVKNGIYATNFGGGQVDITNGKFVFSCTEAYKIEDGKIGAPVKGATLIGNGADALTKVSMIGNDLKLDDGVGTCGKEGQGVPVGVGQPTLRLDGLTVGGTG